MKKKQQKTDTILVWSPEQSTKKEDVLNRSSKRQSAKKDEKKDSPEEMIRKLQGIFCRGRYQSWISYQVRHRK